MRRACRINPWPEWLTGEIVQLVVKVAAAALFAWVPYALIC
jgi:hypothetical protein